MHTTTRACAHNTHTRVYTTDRIFDGLTAERQKSNKIISRSAPAHSGGSSSLVISHTAAAQRPSWLLSFAKSGCARTSAMAVDDRLMLGLGF